MENVILTVHLILALLLIGVVLLQRSEGGGLGMGGGGAMTGRAAATALAKLTWIFAALFIVTSITLTVLAAQKAGSSSVIDQIGAERPAPAAPAAPASPLGTDLLPPTATDAPATPPKAEN
jgi:preprotein translocase subunit SecG